MAKLHAPECHDLAEDFMRHEDGLLTDANVNELANDIQQCIEDFIEAAKAVPLPANQPKQ